jgi:ribosomal protein S17
MELDEELNCFFAEWVTNNKYLSPALSWHSGLFVVKGTVIKVELNRFTVSYQNKFIHKKYEEYCKNMLVALKEPLTGFVKSKNMEFLTVHYEFRYTEGRYNKTVMYS